MRREVKFRSVFEHLPMTVRAAVDKSGGVAEADMLVRQAVADAVVVKAEKGDGDVVIYLSTRHLDRDGDIVTPDGWDLRFYEMNPVGLWNHDWMSAPIYKANWTRPDQIGLMQSITFADTEEAQDYKRLVVGGFLKTFSAGFRADQALRRTDKAFAEAVTQFSVTWPEFGDAERDAVERIITRKTLFESSLCNIPANPWAMVLAVSKGAIQLSDTVKAALKVEEWVQKAVDAKIAEAKTRSFPRRKAVEPSITPPTGPIPPQAPPLAAPAAPTMKVGLVAAPFRVSAPAAPTMKVRAAPTPESIAASVRDVIKRLRGEV